MDRDFEYTSEALLHCRCGHEFRLATPERYVGNHITCPTCGGQSVLREGAGGDVSETPVGNVLYKFYWLD